MANLSKWRILKDLDPKLFKKIRLIHICGYSGKEVIFTTSDDNVYAFGDNSYGMLGLGHLSKVSTPAKLDELCGKQLINLSSGTGHVVGLTRNGECYSWGYTNFGQLGNGFTHNSYKPKRIEGLVGRHVVGICCGLYTSFVWTNYGAVYAFGSNESIPLGIGNSVKDQYIPILMVGFSGEKIISISCGAKHYLALTETGHVYSWGHNYSGQCGSSTASVISVPTQMTTIDTNKVFIKSISCGQYHSLLLSSDGDVYLCGTDDFPEAKRFVPIKVNPIGVKFTEIASNLLNMVSIAKSESEFCYVWGKCVDKYIEEPMETKFTSTFDVLADFCGVKVSGIPMELECNWSRIQILLKCLFNNPKESDFRFKVDNKYIYVKKYILKNLCNHYRVMFSGVWGESDVKEIEIKDFSYSVYYAFVEYIYTDIIEFKLSEVVQMYDLANAYLEDELKQRSIEYMKNNISVENFCELYLVSLKYNIKELEIALLYFSEYNLSLIEKTETFTKMDKKVYKRFIKDRFELKRISV